MSDSPPVLGASLTNYISTTKCYEVSSVVPYCATTHLQLLLSLQGELLERLDNDPSIGAVIHKNGRASHPCLQVVDGQRDVLGVILGKVSKKMGKL